MIAYNEFRLTKRHGRIVSRKVYTFKWTNKAIAVRKKLHQPNIQPKCNLPKPILPKLSKEDRLSKLPYSDYHNKLVTSLYSDDKENRILRQQAEKAAHELKIKQLAAKQKERRMLLKEKRTQQSFSKVVIKTKTDPYFDIFYTSSPYVMIKELLEQLNLKLSTQLKQYKSIALYPPHSTQECLLFVNPAAQLIF